MKNNARGKTWHTQRVQEPHLSEIQPDRVHRNLVPDGTPGRIRTFDQKIKSLLLYQLSYGGKFVGGESNKLEELCKLLFDGNESSRRIHLPTRLPRGVMVTQEILNLLFKVRALAR